MRFMEILRISFDALMRNKMRSLLTMLGIIIGVGAVIAMVAIGQGAQVSVDAQNQQPRIQYPHGVPRNNLPGRSDVRGWDGHDAHRG